MDERLLGIIKEIRGNKQLSTRDEAATKQAIVLPILYNLGWDIFDADKVYPEYPVSNGRVDYSLRHDAQNKVFIETKKISENLEIHQEQLLKYSFSKGVRLTILTNGMRWWFYLPLRESDWEKRRFYTIDIRDQDTDSIVNKFNDLLSKENVISGNAVKNAEKLYDSNMKKDSINETLPKAWDKILTEPDRIMIDLLSEVTGNICGYTPDKNTTMDFLKNISKTIRSVLPESVNATIKPPSKSHLSIDGHDYSFKSIRAFSFKGHRYPVRHWREVLITICGLMFLDHKDQFYKITDLKGRKNPYFSKNPNALKRPKKIPSSNIYIETGFSANDIVKFSKKILETVGYKSNDLRIELNN